MSDKDAYSIEKIHKSFDIILEEIDESIEWILSRLESYPKTVVHEYNYTMDIAHAYNKKINHMYNDLVNTTSNIIDPEIKNVYDVNLEKFMIKIMMIEEIILENAPLIAYQEIPKLYS